MTLPNFLIIGAAKAGTSSLFRYMVQHPQVYGPETKEPSFFAFEGETPDFRGPGDHILNRAVVTKLEDYEELFRDSVGYTAVGEASVVYLYSKKAPERIRHYIPDAKLIMVLRNPVERAVSSFSHMLRDGFEPEHDFSKALDLEDERIRKNWQHLWHYRQMGFYAEQLQRYFELFRKEQIAVFIYDDFSKNPQGVIRQIFRFLDVDDEFMPDISRSYNVSGSPRSKTIHKLIMQNNYIKRILKPFIPAIVRQRMQNAILNANLVKMRAEITDETRQQLKDIYRNDIARLEGMLDRDLSDWLN